MQIRIYWIALFSILVWGLYGNHAVPFWDFWGLDLQIFHAFHHCEFRNQPYPIAGSVCGDALGRPIVYPPLHYWHFVWTRWFSFKETLIIWSAANLFLLFLSYPFLKNLLNIKNDFLSFSFWSLLILQFPTAFTLERASNDFYLYLYLMLGLGFYLNGKLKLSGFWTGLAAIAKIYPIFAAVPFVAGLLKTRSQMWKWILGATIAVLLPSLFWFEETRIVFFEIIPKHAANLPATDDTATISHSLKSLFPKHIWMGNFAFFATLGILAFRAFHYFRENPEFFTFFGMAFCSYLASIAFDYHLILAYPLLFWVAYRASELRSPWLMGIVIFGFLGFFWDRNLLIVQKKSNELIWAQWIWYLALLWTTPKWISKKSPL